MMWVGNGGAVACCEKVIFSETLMVFHSRIPHSRVKEKECYKVKGETKETRTVMLFTRKEGKCVPR